MLKYLIGGGSLFGVCYLGFGALSLSSLVHTAAVRNISYSPTESDYLDLGHGDSYLLEDDGSTIDLGEAGEGEAEMTLDLGIAVLSILVGVWALLGSGLYLLNTKV